MAGSQPKISVRSLIMWVIAPILVLVLAVVVAVTVLNNSSDSPVTERCRVPLDGNVFSYTPDRMANAAMITAVAIRRNLPPRAATIALATAIQESGLRNLDHGDRDSVGLFQQRTSQGWGTVAQIMDPVYSTNKFYDALVKIPNYATGEVTKVAQAVQLSGFPEAYADHESEGRALASALSGYSGLVVSCELPQDEPTAGMANEANFVERMQRDFGPNMFTVSTSGASTRFTINQRSASYTDEATLQALANWSVVNALEFHLNVVRAPGGTWLRSEKFWATTGPSLAENPAGAVVVTPTAPAP